MKAEALLNRIKKNIKAIKKYVANENLSCYRVYDWDMPEYPLAIDVYDAYILVYEYRTSFSLQEDLHALWLSDSLYAIELALDCKRESMYVKTRARQRGNAQYEKVNDKKQFFHVRESGLLFAINLTDYLDTGLFLDHRITRSMVRSISANKHVLNLFAYTGSFSVYALAGGANQVTTVDLSNTYLNWSKDNVRLNKLDESKHLIIKADVKQWLTEQEKELYDIVILDPPTVSKSKMAKTSFSVQEDHVMLINNCLRLMKNGGVLFFSTNFREFELNEFEINSNKIEDITSSTIPADFRNKKIHYCWKIYKT